MKILLVINGYPPRYIGGSEVYTQTLALALHNAGCTVSILTREENPFLPDYHIRSEVDSLCNDIPIYLMNHARSNARFQNDAIDDIFKGILEHIKPDIVHFGHLNRLSIGLTEIAKQSGLKVVFTLHDFWMMCPRGQFLQWGLTKDEPWALCDGQNDTKCANKCFNRFVEGLDFERELLKWVDWVGNRMAASKASCDAVDLFIAPSRYLQQRFIDEFELDSDKIKILDYGFDLSRLQERTRDLESQFVFGYIGRHHPSKGIHLLIDAFCQLEDDALLRIWGRPQGQLTQSLKRRAKNYSRESQRIEWLPEYNNEDIVKDVFNRCDCIVVPSIWDENSPLVIHEAQQCRVPVITAAHGGMGEYVRDGVNGITFKHRDTNCLQDAMHRAITEPTSTAELGCKGYLYSNDGIIQSKEKHASEIIRYYEHLLRIPMGVNE